MKLLPKMPGKVLFQTETRSKEQWRGLREAMAFRKQAGFPTNTKVLQVCIGKVHPINGAKSSYWVVAETK
jgi:hypothetical protein